MYSNIAHSMQIWRSQEILLWIEAFFVFARLASDFSRLQSIYGSGCSVCSISTEVIWSQYFYLFLNHFFCNKDLYMYTCIYVYMYICICIYVYVCIQVEAIHTYLVHSSSADLGGGFIFYFHPTIWGNDPIWPLHIFRIWLVQPPTRYTFFWIHVTFWTPERQPPFEKKFGGSKIGWWYVHPYGIETKNMGWNWYLQVKIDGLPIPILVVF